MTHWTPKHTKLALEKKLTRSAILMYEWLVREGIEGKTETVDLKDFNKFISQYQGKPLDNRTVKDAADRLESAGIVTWYCFTQFVRKVTLKSLRDFNAPKLKIQPIKTSDQPVKNAEEDTPNQENSADCALAAAAEELKLIGQIGEEVCKNLETNIEECEKAGIYFDSEEAVKVLAWEEPLEVKTAIKLFFKRGGHEKIENPEGWLRRCLEKRWYEKPQFNFSQAILHLANLVGLSNEMHYSSC